MLNTDDLRYYTGIGTGYTAEAMMARAADEIERLRSVIDSAADLVDYEIGAGEEARMIREWKETPNVQGSGGNVTTK